MIIASAKSTKVVLQIPANHFSPATRELLEHIKEKISHMFNQPEKAVLVAIS